MGSSTCWGPTRAGSPSSSPGASGSPCSPRRSRSASSGVLVERGVLKRIYGTKNANFAGVLVTYGLAIMIPDLVRMTFGRPGKPFAIPEALSGSLFRIGALDVHNYRVFILVVTAALLPLLWLLLNKTNLGLVIRAGHQRQPHGAAPRHQRGPHVDDHLRPRRRARRVRGRDHRAAGGGGARDGRAHPDRVLHRHGGRRHGDLPGGRRGRAPHRRDAGPDRHGLRRARRRGHLPRDGPRAARAARGDSSARRGCPRSERPGPGRAGAGHRAALRRLHAVLPGPAHRGPGLRALRAGLRRAARPRGRALAGALRVPRRGRLRHRHPPGPLPPPARAEPAGRGGRRASSPR